MRLREGEGWTEMEREGENPERAREGVFVSVVVKVVQRRRWRVGLRNVCAKPKHC